MVRVISNRSMAVGVALLWTLIAVLGMGVQTTYASGGVHEVTYVATATGFEGPDALPAGTSIITLVNERNDLVHLQLLKLREGRTLEDLFAFFQSGAEVLPRWIEFAGGPTLTIPGGTSAAGSFLSPGTYIATSFLADPDGVPHAAGGLLKVIQVTAFEPRADVSITFEDYNFVVAGTFTRGAQTIGVTNIGREPHEAILIRLAPGASTHDFLHSMAPGHEGPPAGMPIGGIQAIDGDATGFFTVDLVPGNYVILCAIPDQGVPHFVHGMIYEFSVE